MCKEEGCHPRLTTVVGSWPTLALALAVAAPAPGPNASCTAPEKRAVSLIGVEGAAEVEAVALPDCVDVSDDDVDTLALAVRVCVGEGVSEPEILPVTVCVAVGANEPDELAEFVCDAVGANEPETLAETVRVAVPVAEPVAVNDADGDGAGGGSCSPCTVVESTSPSLVHGPCGSRRMLTLADADSTAVTLPAFGLRNVAARRPSA
jgi:hypothetical protein